MIKICGGGDGEGERKGSRASVAVPGPAALSWMMEVEVMGWRERMVSRERVRAVDVVLPVWRA